MISGTSYCTKWYITLFSNTVPFATQLRIWDCLFLDGRDVIVMTSVAIIWAFRGVFHIQSSDPFSLLNSIRPLTQITHKLPFPHADQILTDLLSAPTANFESILSLLSSNFVCEDDDALLRWIRKMMQLGGMKDRMRGWRKEWHGLVESGKSGEALL